MLLSIFDDISKFTNLNSFHIKLLNEIINGTRAIDLLLYFPKSYIKRKFITKLREIVEGETIILKGLISEVNIKNNGISKILIEFDGADSIEIVYFRGNKFYLDKLYQKNTTKLFSGKITKSGYKWQMIHPEFVFNENREDEIPKNESIYNLPKGLTNQIFSKLINQIFTQLDEKELKEEWMDDNIITENKFPTFFNAVKTLHDIDNKSSIEIQKAKERLIFDELLANQIGLKLLKISYKSYKGRSIKGDGNLRNKVIEKLNFDLTNDQKRALKDIYRDQYDKWKMVRMIQGDVGSGKTIVALLAMLNVIEAGFQTVLMVPTEILAQQHFESISSIISKAEIDVNIALLTSTSKKKKKLLEDMENNKFQIIIGTHAIFQDKVKLNNIGLIIIDEQHRFGVNHRAALSNKDEYADLLFMSATPIPRSLSLVQYGYMDHSLIIEKPKNRLPVITNIVSNLQITMILDKIDEFISRNEKIYWICPLIEESLKLDYIAIEKRETVLRERFGDKLAVIHGRMKDKEISEIMDTFSGKNINQEQDKNLSDKSFIQGSFIEEAKETEGNNKNNTVKKQNATNILLSTTLVEVGVNVPEATLIIIEDAQKFGLSQLHQLRGRVGRSDLQSYCILIYNPKTTSQTGRQRLQALKNSNDGFYIAEQDLKIRGGGELNGLKQSGFDNYKIADIRENQHILSKASDIASDKIKDHKSFSKLDEPTQNLLKIFNIKEINSGGF